MQASNLRVPALIFTVLAWIVIGATLIAALSLVAWLVSYTQFMESPIMLLVTSVAAWIGYAAMLPSIIVAMVWIYAAHANLHRAGISGLNYSPGWATFSFLVPIANLFVPFRAMRELANRSAGEPEELAEADQQDVFAWWGSWIGLFIINLFLIYTILVALTPGVWMTTPFWATQVLIILSYLLAAASAFFLIKVVKQVTADQQNGASALAAFE